MTERKLDINLHTVPISIECRDDLAPEMLRSYSKCVEFMAIWTKLHEEKEGRDGIPFDHVMSKFAENVTRCLFGKTGGNG